MTGWSIDDVGVLDASNDANLLYEVLETIMALFYEHPETYGKIMRSSIALNASFFNTHRMVTQYLRNAYSRQSSH